MKLLRHILIPFVPVYWLITKFRNILYNLGIKKSKAFNLPIICVGNLSVGGTGKSPMIEYLIRDLYTTYRVATLSRGYKRQLKGFRIANANYNASDIGDEPFQFYKKFGNSIQVAVDSNRCNGISKLLQQNLPPEIILLDDAFQHRKVKAGFNILLTTYQHPFFKDVVLPTGNLREPCAGYKRANIIVVTKCPKLLKNKEKQFFLDGINAQKHQRVFFSSITYSNYVFSKTKKVKLQHFNSFVLVTGIANALPLVTYLKSKNLNFTHLNFKDHYTFSKDDISTLSAYDYVLTTEKDYVRLEDYKVLQEKLFYLPIEICLEDEKTFKTAVTDFVQRF